MKDNVRVVKPILIAVFFFSGVSALIYQIIWIRMLGQVFGLTAVAVTTVLTAFMAGLAAGSYLFGKLIDKRKDPLFVFMLLEAGIGAFALLFPVILDVLTGVYTALTKTIRPDVYVNSIFRFAVSFIVLLPPTTLMGGTLPVLSKYYVTSLRGLGGNVGRLYAANNLGAVSGCVLSSFVLIGIIGLSGNIILAACFNFGIAAVVFFIRKTRTGETPHDNGKNPEESKTKKAAEPERYSPAFLRLVLWVFAIEGFTTLSYEVIWTRILLGISCDRSVYFYATVIAAFIAGISIGSLIITRFVDRRKNLVFLLGAIEIAIGIVSCVLLIVFVPLAGHLNTVRPQYGEPWIFSLGTEYLLFFLLLIAPAVLMGTTFPIVAGIYTTNIGKVGRKIGVIGCLDTIGSIFGSFAAGFILIPFLGVVNAVLVTAALNVCIGLALIIAHPRTRRPIKAVAALSTLCAAVIVLVFAPGERYFRHWQTEEEGDRLLFYREGLGSTVAVPEEFDGVKELAIDGAVTAIAEYGDIRVHKLLGYLPYLLCDNPRTALVVGFGMGVTAQSLIQDDIEEVVCVEICPEILYGSTGYFKEENGGVLSEPKLRVVVDDGRSFLAASTDMYDVITTNAVHPRLSINIYTKEFYELCKRRLSEHGVMCQWMATNWMTENEYKMLVRSFVEVFPHTSLWVCNIGHILLVGTPGPLEVDFRKLDLQLRRQKVKADLRTVHLDDPFALLALFACTEEKLIPYCSDVPPATDNYPLPEFSRYISRHPNLAIIDELLRYSRNPESRVFNLPGGEEVGRIGKYVEAEVNFLKARYADYDSPGSDTLGYLETAVRLNPYNYAFYHALGDKYSENGQYGKAIDAYREEIALDEDNPLGYVNLSFAFMRTDSPDAAMEAAGKALRIDPDNGLARYLLSVIYRMELRFGEALEELDFVAKHYPTFINAVFETGEVYVALGRYGEAKKAFETFLNTSRNKKMNNDARLFIDEISRAGY
ncbi:MAG: fused MFS/spermidine synthase [Spirochaetales bacterium]|nr:fused MFS/spermidine synthase [Spirochaetales bacterium]